MSCSAAEPDWTLTPPGLKAVMLLDLQMVVSEAARAKGRGGL